MVTVTGRGPHPTYIYIYIETYIYIHMLDSVKLHAETHMIVVWLMLWMVWIASSGFAAADFMNDYKHYCKKLLF